MKRNSKDTRFVRTQKLRCEFEFEQIGSVMILYDTDRPGKMSVTNDAGAAVDFILNYSDNRTWTRLIYRDSDGVFDELAIKDGIFYGFASIRETTLEGALEFIEATTIRV